MAVARQTRPTDPAAEREAVANDPTFPRPADAQLPEADPLLGSPDTGVAPAQALREGDATIRGDRVHPMPPTRRDYGWRAILLGVAAFAIIFLIAIFAGIFELGSDEASAPPAPIADSPGDNNVIDNDSETGGAAPGGMTAEPNAADVPGGGTPAQPNQ
ncbi:hypothetical protein [Propylenella binzhouense]|uniref:Uncharacterized protein n=1 Tax=Propylenella binzhouense TaxID=2555902 RepID=A0A964WTJ9_9HYPH|nr:hypothetical protein [Propylenella binzhouense]MYZ48079.1 hypothetical protein [Propylenella binzhouense]